LFGDVKSQSRGWSGFGVIVSNIRNVLALNSNFEIKFIYGQANMVSDSLAKVKKINLKVARE